MAEQQWMSIVEYARTFTISDMTIRRRIKTGKLHAVLKNGKYYIPVSTDERGNPVRESFSSQITNNRNQVKLPSQHHFQNHYPPQQLERDLVVVKRQPSPEPSFSTLNNSSSITAAPSSQTNFSGIIPTEIKRSFQGHSTAVVGTDSLLHFCEVSLKKINDTERRYELEYKNKIEALEEKIKNKDHELSLLKQQIEDLQLLIKIMEKKK